MKERSLEGEGGRELELAAGRRGGRSELAERKGEELSSVAGDLLPGELDGDVWPDLER